MVVPGDHGPHLGHSGLAELAGKRLEQGPSGATQPDARLDRLARERGLSRSELLRALLAEASGAPAAAPEPPTRSEALELLAAKARSGNVAAVVALERALRLAGDHDSLASALQTRLERGAAEDEAAVLTELGRLYDEHLDRKEEALGMILRAIELDPTNEAAHDAAYRLVFNDPDRFADELAALFEPYRKR